MGDIEVIAYELYRENIARVVASSPLIDWSWYTAWPRIRGGASKGDPRVPKPWKDVNDKTGANRRIAVSTRRTSARDCGHPRHRPVRAGARWRLRADLSPHRRRRLHVRGFISRAPAFIGRTGSLRVYIPCAQVGWGHVSDTRSCRRTRVQRQGVARIGPTSPPQRRTPPRARRRRRVRRPVRR